MKAKNYKINKSSNKIIYNNKHLQQQTFTTTIIYNNKHKNLVFKIM